MVNLGHVTKKIGHSLAAGWRHAARAYNNSVYIRARLKWNAIIKIQRRMEGRHEIVLQFITINTDHKARTTDNKQRDKHRNSFIIMIS